MKLPELKGAYIFPSEQFKLNAKIPSAQLVFWVLLLGFFFWMRLFEEQDIQVLFSSKMSFCMCAIINIWGT